MALVSTGFRLSVSLADTSGSISTLQYDLRSADFAAATTDAGTVLAALGDMTDSVVSSYSIAEVFEEDALALPANAENAIKASLSLYLDGAGQKRANIKVPAPTADIFTAASGPGFNTVDGGDAAVGAYIALYQVTGGVANISDGEEVRDTDPFAGGKRISRASQNP